MSERQPDWDINFKDGKDAEQWLETVLGLPLDTIEVKADDLFFKHNHAYIEYECQGRDGVWRPSGIATTKAEFWFIKFGGKPAGLIVETAWLKRAFETARKNRAQLDCRDGSNPTRGVAVTITDLWRAS